MHENGCSLQVLLLTLACQPAERGVARPLLAGETTDDNLACGGDNCCPDSLYKRDSTGIC